MKCPVMARRRRRAKPAEHAEPRLLQGGIQRALAGSRRGESAGDLGSDMVLHFQSHGTVTSPLYGKDARMHLLALLLNRPHRNPDGEMP